MNPDTPRACLGKDKLFDSTHPTHHAEAKALCDTCPAIDLCREELRAVIADHGYDKQKGPRGTWAGILLGSFARPGPKARAAA